jgi:hypothetical protein
VGATLDKIGHFVESSGPRPVEQNWYFGSGAASFHRLQLTLGVGEQSGRKPV